MSLEAHAAFALASAAILAAPGPVVVYLVSCAATRGLGAAAWALGAVLAGDACAMAISLTAGAAVLSASAALFSVLRLAGAAYLIWAGARMTMTPGKRSAQAPSAPRMAGAAFLLALTHPAGLIFYAAFVPQFVDATAPAAPQLLALGATFLAVALLVLGGWTLAAARMGAALRVGNSPLFRRLAGAVMIAVGVAGAAMIWRA